MRSSGTKMAVLAFSLAVICGLTGCLLEDPVIGHTVQQGNDNVHFGGYGSAGEKFYVWAWNWNEREWVQCLGQFSLWTGAVADGSLAAELEKFDPFVAQDGSEWWYWGDRFWIPPECWIGVPGDYRAAVTVVNEFGDQNVMYMTAGGGVNSAVDWIDIYCTDEDLQDFPRWEY